MENEGVKEEKPREVLFHCRDIWKFHKLLPSVLVFADIRGLIADLIDRGGIIIMRLIDATGQIRVEFHRSESNEESWRIIKKIRKMDRICITGLVREKEEKLFIIPEGFQIFLPKTISNLSLQELDENIVSSQFFLARIRSRAASFLINNGFEEFEPNMISVTRGETKIDPLRVIFNGYGSPLYLIPSPAAQLREAIITAPAEKVFCVSRCFSATIRDGYTSAESMILCLRQLNISIEEICTLGESIIKNILGHFTTMPEIYDATWLSGKAWKRVTCKTIFPEGAIDLPEIQIQLAQPEEKISHIFRVIWPPNHIIAEGHIESISKDISLGGMTIHLEKIVLILKDFPFRRLRHLGLRR